jgi:glyoxylase-like metal-dependent hydrolase (beta-lactamase superfamily II)
MPRLVLDKLYQLTLPTPFPVGPVNVYLASDDPITLIDTGPRDDATRAALDDELRALGLARSDVRRIVITHAHADHYGLAAEIVRDGAARSTRVEVWTHAYNRIWLEDYEAERVRRLMFYGQILIESGIPPEERERLAGARRGMGRLGEAVGIDREIGEGGALSFAGKTWRALHMPGHAGGMLCFFEPGSRTLLSSDHLLRDISSNPVVEPAPDLTAPKPRRLVEYLREIQRAADLQPAIAWTGHGEPITDVRKLVRQRTLFHNRRAQRILDLMGGREVTAYEIAGPLFGQLSGIDSFLALSEVIGHLEWLEDQRRLQSVRRGEVVYWRITQSGGVSPPPD